MAYMTRLPRIDAQFGEVAIVCDSDWAILSPSMAIAMAAALLDAAAAAKGHEIISRARSCRPS